jgi:hypothetical protein
MAVHKFFAELASGSAKNWHRYFSTDRILLKGQHHEIFDFRFFKWISVPQALDYTNGVDTTGAP